MNPFDNLPESKLAYLDPYFYQLKRHKYKLKPHVFMGERLSFEIGKVYLECIVQKRKVVLRGASTSNNKQLDFGVKEIRSPMHLIRVLDYYHVGTAGRKRRSNNTYGNVYSVKQGKKYNNINKNKQKQLEKTVRKYVNTHKGYTISREKVAKEYQVKLKFIDPIFNKLNREGKIQKREGRSWGAIEDDMRHPTLWYVKK